MTKAKKFQYRIQYVDNTFQMVDWTKRDYEDVGHDMTNGKLVIVLDDGIFRLDHIRAIVAMPEPEPEVEIDNEGKLTEYGGYDADTIAWLKSEGIDIVNGGSKE